jgi:hypothetical protein
MTTKPKYPKVHVQLSGEDGNGFMIVGRVSREMRRAGVPIDEISAFTNEATSGNYDHLLQTAMAWVTVE